MSLTNFLLFVLFTIVREIISTIASCSYYCTSYSIIVWIFYISLLIVHIYKA